MRYLLSELIFEFDLRIFIALSSDCLEKMCEFGEQWRAGISVILLKRITLIRAMTFSMGMIGALREFTFNLPLDRSATCPLENGFGLLRRLGHDRNQFSEILHATPRNARVNHNFTC
jgi:hypothetical protein